MRNNYWPLLEMPVALPMDFKMSFADLFFFRVTVRGLLQRGLINDAPDVLVWIADLRKFLRLEQWMNELRGPVSSSYQLSLLWLHAAALAWYHQQVGQQNLANQLEVARDQLEIRYWRIFGATLPSGWKILFAGYRAPMHYKFVESMPATRGFSLHVVTHQLLIKSLYLAQPLDLHQAEVADAVVQLKNSLRPELDRDVRLEIVLTLSALGAISREESAALSSVGELQRLLNTPISGVPVRAQREHFHAQLLAQLLVLMAGRGVPPAVADENISDADRPV